MGSGDLFFPNNASLILLLSGLVPEIQGDHGAIVCRLPLAMLQVDSDFQIPKLQKGFPANPF